MPSDSRCCRPSSSKHVHATETVDGPRRDVRRHHCPIQMIFSKHESAGITSNLIQELWEPWLCYPSMNQVTQVIIIETSAQATIITSSELQTLVRGRMIKDHLIRQVGILEYRRYHHAQNVFVAWYQEHGAGSTNSSTAGRSFFTSLGHLSETWQVR